MYLLEGFCVVALSHVCHLLCQHGCHSLTLHERLGNVLLGQRRQRDALHAALYGAQDKLGLQAHQYEVGVCGRLLNELEQLIGRGSVHALGQPLQHHSAPALTGFEREAFLQAVALLHIVCYLLVLCLDVRKPHLGVEIYAFLQLFTPLGQIIDRCGSVGALCFIYREREVQVGVRPACRHAATGTRLARPLAGGVLAEQMPGQGKRHGHGSCAFAAAEHERMGHTSFVHHPQHMLLDLVLSNDVCVCYCAHPPWVLLCRAALS